MDGWADRRGVWLIAALIPCVAAATISARQTTSDLVTVKGCIDGRVLTVVDDSGLGDRPRRYDLTGDKHVTALLKEHSGHLDEITGTLKAGKNGPQAVGAEKPIPKGRVYVAAGKSDPPSDNWVTRPSIKVRDVKHLSDRCRVS